jgi:large-conductance mechanosensitive channel
MVGDSVGFFFLGVVIALIIGCVQCNRTWGNRPENAVSSLGAFIGTIFEWLIFFAVATVIVHYIRKAHVLTNQGRERERLAAIDSELTKNAL